MAPASSLPRVPGWHASTKDNSIDMSDTKTPVALDEDEQAALNAQVKHNQAIAEHHIEILKRIQRLEKLGGSQDYSVTVLEVLKAFNGTISLAFLGPVLPDHLVLAKVREELVKAGRITETTVKNRKILHLATAA